MFPFEVGFQESFRVNAFAFMRIAKEGNSEDEMSPSGDSWPFSMGRAPEAGSWVGFLQLSIPDRLLSPCIRWSLIDGRANLQPSELVQNGAGACE